MKKYLSALLALAMLLSLAACGGGGSSSGDSGSSGGSPAPQEKTSITFADVGWDSIKLNNALAGLVAEEVFGYTWEETPGSTPISHEALMLGDRIVLLTSCPARLKKIYDVKMPKPRDTMSEEFLYLRNEISENMDLAL